MRSLPALLAAAVLCLGAARASATGIARAAHTTSLLPTGDVLIAGGMSDVTNASRLATAELLQSSHGNTYINVGSMSIARASATATVLPNGLVLIAGGINAANGVNASVELYDPATQTFPAASVVTVGVTARFNHTATLLNNGSVLLCGGMNAAPPSNVPTTSCDYYTPSGINEPSGTLCPVSANNYVGCVTAVPLGGMAFARAFHTATLLKNGDVLIAGGFNPMAAATNGWLTTMERFHAAGAGSFGSAANLFEARAYHTATLMGDGKVLIAGGFNGNNLFENQGILDTEEIYDPTSDSVAPAPQLNTRRLMHTALLSADGSVVFFGGLGNITTSYYSAAISAGKTDGPPVYLTVSYAGVLPQGTMTTPPKSFFFKTGGEVLTQSVVGTVTNGVIAVSSANMDFGTGIAYFGAGSSTDPATGLQVNMAGVNIGCKPPPNDDTCGFIPETELMTLDNLNQGPIFFQPAKGISVTGTVTGGTLVFPGPTLKADQIGPENLSNTSSLTMDITIGGLPANIIGANFLGGTLKLTDGSFTQPSSFTVSALGSNPVDVSGPTVIGTGSDKLGQLILPGITFTGVTGKILWAGTTDTYKIPPPSIAAGEGSPKMAGTGDVKYVPSKVNVAGSAINAAADVSTITIRSMVFGSPEYYIPSNNIAQLAPPGAKVKVSFVNEKFGHTATLMPNNDILYVGGLDCVNPFPTLFNAGCGILAPQNDNAFFFGKAFVRLDTPYITKNLNSRSGGSLLKARALHTATLLPSGKILVAGGTDGPNVLSSAEIFDPVAGVSVPTAGAMRDDRDLHSATLLPNGRVLLAGGFTTNATSSDSTNGAEIYYPDTMLFIPTGTMGIPRRAHTATLLPDGTVLVVGGMTTNGVIVGSAEIFRSTTSVWINQASGPALPPRMGHTATLLKDGTVLVVGGTGAGGPLTSVYRFDPSNPGAGWVPRHALPHALYQHSATLLFDGRVLVAGGNDGFGEYNASYIYDPQADASGWVLTDPNGTPLMIPRYGHTATLLPNDTVMLSGGNTRFGIVPTEIEVFHVNASSWSAGGVVFKDGPRTFHTMTLAPDGFVYALGGSNGAIGGGNGASLLTSVDRSYFTTDPDQYTKNAPPSFRQSSIDSATPPIFQAGPANTFTVHGVQFRGATEASGGGSGAANSSFSFPHLVLQQIDGSGGGSSQSSGFVLDLTTQVYLNSNNYQNLDSSLTVALPLIAAQLPIGWYNARVGANDLYSNGVYVQAGPLKPSAAPSAALGTPMGVSSFTWTWSAVPTIGVAGVPGVVDGYNVYEASSGVFLASAPAAAFPSYIQNGLPPNSTAQIIVAAYSISGDGPLRQSATAYTLSTFPSNVTIASVTFNSLLLEWDPNGNTPGTVYEVSQSTDWPGPFTASVSTPVPGIFGLTKNFTTITGLVTNSTYSFRVRSFNNVGLASDFSAIVSTQTRNSVAAVGCGPTFTGNTTTSIQWSWSDAGAVTRYNIYNSSSAGSPIGTAASGNPTFLDVGLATDTLRSIAVTAVTAAGEGPLSPAATCYTQAAVPGFASPPMNSTETTSVSANWTNNDNPNGTQYLIQFASFGATRTVTNLTTPGFTAFFSGLIPDAYYAAQVSALNGANVPSTALQLGTTFTLPAQPQPLTIRGTTPVSISVSWNNNFNSTMTAYQLTTALDSLFTVNVTTAIFFSRHYNASTFTITGLQTSTQYWVRVQAQNPFGQTSQFSGAVTTITFNGGAPPGSLAGTLTALGASGFSGNLGDGTSFDIRSPGGAFPTDTTVTISTYDVSAAGHGPLCPNGVINGTFPAPNTEATTFSITDDPAFQPAHPLRVAFSYTPAELPTPLSQVALSRFDPVSGTCVPLETTFDTVNNVFYAKLNHFSLYQLVQIPLATSADTARIFPNPYRAATDGYVTIDQVPPASRVRVFTLRGEIILDATANGAGIVTWVADNTAGRSIASGLYLVEVESGGTKKLLKLAVIR